MCGYNGKGLKHHTFHFNMKFDIDTEVVNKDSIEFLRNNGTDFNKLKKHGCDQSEVVKGLRKLFRDRRITWVTFHGLVFFHIYKIN